MMHKLEADSIQLRFGEKILLSNIYLKCETGKITGLLGRNGQGKTCLMNIIYGTLTCEKSVRIDNIAQHEAFKSPGLLRYLPQFNFIPESLSLKRVFRDFNVNFSSFTENFPEFESKYKSTVGSLSGGERRLIQLYVIVKSKTHFVMLDEPFTHLSPLHIEKVKIIMAEEKINKGFLITDHMYTEIVDLCDNLYLLTDGKTHLIQNTHEIMKLGYTNL